MIRVVPDKMCPCVATGEEILVRSSQCIRCKPTSPCKLWKLQSESLDQHPRGIEDRIFLQSRPAFGLGNHTFANPPCHLSAPLPLDVDLMAQIEVFIVCTERLVCNWYVPVSKRENQPHNQRVEQVMWFYLSQGWLGPALVLSSWPWDPLNLRNPVKWL